MWQSIKNIYHLLWAIVANVVYDFPSRKLYVIGVTGTDGKTTTALLIEKILSDADKKTVVITTIGAEISGKEYETGLHVTTPSSVGIQRFLKQAVAAGCTHAVLECSSHALDQNRVFGIRFAVGVLTNISHEHLDYHKTMERYTKAKLKLLKNAQTVILNKDDRSYLKAVPQLSGKKILTYSLADQTADIAPEKFPLTSKLFGAFNMQNCLAAASAALTAGIDRSRIQLSIAAFEHPLGRFDVVYDKDFKIIIDFAVTPAAFEQILSEVRKKTSERLIHVFGMSGKRDRSKRPLAGAVSSHFADVIILTADDPRDEPIHAINQEIKKGIAGFTAADPKNSVPESARKNLFEIEDRKLAIDFAIRIARKGDTVLLTGKAHEKSMAMPEGEVPWDEYQAVKDALSKRGT